LLASLGLLIVDQLDDSGMIEWHRLFIFEFPDAGMTVA
jgi:hypothetical protein